MQLFTIGLNKLNMDGSIVYQSNGDPEDTYSIDDIISYARVWTGFEVKSDSKERGGAASSGSTFGKTSLDPMSINIELRDWFPKNDLAGGFIVSIIVARCLDLIVIHMKF